MRKLWVWLTVTFVCVLAAVGYSAVQGDFVLNFTDAAGSTKFYRALGSSANGLVVDVSRVQTITTGTLSNVTAVGTLGSITSTVTTTGYNTVNAVLTTVTVSGNNTEGLQVFLPKTASTTVTMFTSTTNATTLANSSATRRMVHIYNEGSDVLYVKLGTSPTLTSYSFKLQPEAYWEMPVTTYTGTITGLWTGATSTAAVTVY